MSAPISEEASASPFALAPLQVPPLKWVTLWRTARGSHAENLYAGDTLIGSIERQASGYPYSMNAPRYRPLGVKATVEEARAAVEEKVASVLRECRVWSCPKPGK